jgi:flagellar biosynthesis protein FliR
VAAPAVALAFVVQIALGALSRVVPRFGSFTLAFPLAFAAALVATVLSVPLAAEHVPAPILSIP